MAIYTSKLPQNIESIKVTTLKELITILPDTISYPLNIWVGGKLAMYGTTTGNIVFISELNDNQLTPEIKEYFNNLSSPLGINATVCNEWRNQRNIAFRLYDKGSLIIDKINFTYKQIPSPVAIPLLTIEDVVKKLPKTIRWKQTLYLTGGLVKNGWSFNDADIITFDITESSELKNMRIYFTNLFGWKTDVGQKVMTEREPIYLYKIYENGVLCLP